VMAFGNAKTTISKIVTALDEYSGLAV